MVCFVSIVERRIDIKPREFNSRLFYLSTKVLYAEVINMYNELSKSAIKVKEVTYNSKGVASHLEGWRRISLTRDYSDDSLIYCPFCGSVRTFKE